MEEKLPRMELERFEILAKSHGADLRRWPAAERLAAEPLARQAEAQALLAAETELDAWLDGYRTPAPSVQLSAAILAAAPQARRRSSWGGVFGYWLSGAGVAVAVATGVALGVGLTRPQVRQMNQAEALGLGAADLGAEVSVEQSS